MLDLVFVALSIYLLVRAIQIFRAISRHKKIFEEFQQSRSLAVLVWLLPATPLAALLAKPVFGSLSAIAVAVALCIPVIVSSKKQLSAFEKSGTDRTAGAHEAVYSAWIASISTLSFVAAVNFVFAAVWFIGNQ